MSEQKFIYHYYASSQQKLGEMVNIDGIINSIIPIDSMARYRQVKEVIAKDNNVSADNLVINSLSFLCTVKEPKQ